MFDFVNETITNKVTTAITSESGIKDFWTGLGKALSKIKEGLTTILPEIMSFLGEYWIFILPIGVYFLVKILFFFKAMLRG